MCTVIAAVLLMACQRAPPPRPTPLRLSWQPRADLQIAREASAVGLALAPDGRRLLVAAALEEDMPALWLHDFSTGEWTSLPGTNSGTLPFWSPDGARFGFFGGGALRTFDVASGRVDSLAAAPHPHGGAWHPNGDIIFAPDSGGLVRRRSDGALEAFTRVEGPIELSHRFPQIVADGTRVLFFVHSPSAARQGTWTIAWDHTGDRRRLQGGATAAIALADALLYGSGDALLMQSVDWEAAALTGPTALVSATVGRSGDGQLTMAAAADTVLVAQPESPLRELRWVDRAGTTLGALGEAMQAWDVRISQFPVNQVMDDTRVAVTRRDPQLATLDVWVYEGTRPLPRRISRSINRDDSPVWSRDGRQLAWVNARRSINVRRADASTVEAERPPHATPLALSDWTAAPQSFLVASVASSTSGQDLVLLPSQSNAERAAQAPRPYRVTPFNEMQGVVSADGHWLAYVSDESGLQEIYVDAFPTPAETRRARVTSGGGSEPRWDGQGRLYFRRGREIHEVRLDSRGGAPEAIASVRLFTASADIRSFDITVDATRFLLNLPVAPEPTAPALVLLHASGLLRAPQP